MKDIYLILLILLSTQSAIGQNLIKNSGFEDKGSSYPSDVAQIGNTSNKYLKDWQCRYNYSTSDPTYPHSPEWFYNGHFGNYAYKENGCIGMGTYELIQQNLDNKLENQGAGSKYFYTLSGYLKPSKRFVEASSENFSYDNEIKLKVYIGSRKFTYKEENANPDLYCTPDYLTLENNGIWKEVGSIDIDESNFSLAEFVHQGIWQPFHINFKVPNNTADYRWVMIQLESSSSFTSANCPEAYVLFDDLALEKQSVCTHPCTPNLPNPDVVFGFSDILYAGRGFWGNLFENAIGIRFELWNSYGELIYVQEAHDPNGLKDTGYDDYMFVWVGRKPDGSLFPQDVYNYKLRYWNCRRTEVVRGDITYIPYEDGAVQGYDIYRTEFQNCCPDDLYIQNKEYTGNTTERADNYAYFGREVTINEPFGNVLVKSGANLEVYSGIDVIIEEGFYVETGAHFETHIKHCHRTREIEQPERNREQLEKSFHNNSANLNNAVYPNPSTTGVFELRYPVQGDIKVFNAQGQLIKKIVTENKKMTIDLTGQPKGMYFLHLENSGNKEMLKLIYLQNRP